MKNKPAGLRKGLALGTVTGVVFGLASVVGAGTASAATTTLNYKCSYPLIGTRDLKVEIATNIPSKLGVNQETGTIQTTWKATLGADTTTGLNAVDAATIEGVAVAKADVDGPGLPGLPVTIDNALKKTNIPASGAFQIEGYGEAASIGFTDTGKATAKLGNMDLRITLRKKDGTSSALGTFSSVCTLNPGQNTTVAEADIVQGDQPIPPPLPKPDWFPASDPNLPKGTLNYAFNLAGESAIKRANGKVPLTGGIDVAVDGGTGAITGALTLKQTKGQMAILGFLPVTATVDFQQVGATTGTYENGEIKTKSTMFIKFPSFAVMGLIPIGGGANCQTVEPSVIDMNSTPGAFFDPKKGGPYKSPAYTISAIKDCGPLNGIIGLFAAGPGNTIDMTLSPKA